MSLKSRCPLLGTFVKTLNLKCLKSIKLKRHVKDNNSLYLCYEITNADEFHTSFHAWNRTLDWIKSKFNSSNFRLFSEWLNHLQFSVILRLLRLLLYHHITRWKTYQLKSNPHRHWHVNYTSESGGQSSVEVSWTALLKLSITHLDIHVVVLLRYESPAVWVHSTKSTAEDHCIQ